MKKIGVFVLFLFIGFNFCTKNPADESNTSTGNRAPDIVSMTAVPAVLNINMAGQVDSALVTVIVTDYDDTCVTYTFNASLGKLSNQNGKEITYTPPAEPGDYVVSCSVSDGEASAVDSVAVQVLPPEPVSKIVFESVIDDFREIFTINSDGSDLKRITNNLTYYDNTVYEPDWSPDGSKIVFQCNYGYNDLYVMNSDGSNPTMLLDNEYFQPLGYTSCSLEYPSWSPDGSKIAFTLSRSEPGLLTYGYIYVMDADGSNIIRLTDTNKTDMYPTWSPDGSKIAFCSNRDGWWQIFVMNSDGSNQTNLNARPLGLSPSWSRVSNKIVFQAEFGNICIVNSDGSNAKFLTNNFTNDLPNYHNPTWSPDGSMIAFESRRFEPTFGRIIIGIYIMNADGSNQRFITTGRRPSWSPFIH